MADNCGIPGCKSSVRKHKTLFRLPFENEELLEKWKENLPDGIDYSETFLICQDHFEDEFLIRSDMDTFLCAEAYPTIFKSKHGKLLVDQANSCRFCLKQLIENGGSFISDSTRKYFRNITNLELSDESIYSEKMCNSCSKDLKYCSNFKNRLIGNQKKLIEFFENFEYDQEINENLEVKLELHGEGQENFEGQKSLLDVDYAYYDVIKNEEEAPQEEPSSRHSTSEAKPKKIKLPKVKRNFSKEK